MKFSSLSSPPVTPEPGVGGFPATKTLECFPPPIAAFLSFAGATSKVRKATLFLFSVVVLLVGGAAAARGQSVLDGFDPNANGIVHVVVVQPDGKILIGGAFTTLSPNGGPPVTRNKIARLNTDGTLDTAFNPNANSSVRSIAVQADGKILVGGLFESIGGQARNFIARLDATTGLADSFDPNPSGVSTSVSSIVVQADGKILVGGPFTSMGGQARNRIARLDATTGLADSFNPNASSNVESIVVQADGKILAGGGFTNIGGATRNFIARLDATTGLADSFNPNPNANSGVFAIAVQADAKILVGGLFVSIGGQARTHIARLDATTGLADSFNPAANISFEGFGVGAIVVQADGKILAGGSFTSIGGQGRNHIARLDATTGLADSFDPNANFDVYSMAVQADGKILMGGFFTNLAPNGAAAVTRNRIARFSVAPVISSPLVATGTVGLPFTYQFTASGATSLDIPGSVAPGLTFNPSLPAIAGVPTLAGTFPVALRATNSVGTSNATLSITVQPAPSGPVIISSNCATGRTGRAFSFQLRTMGGSSATRFAVENGLPPGFNLDPSTGFIAGTPASDGNFSLAVSAIDGAAITRSTLQLTFTSDPTVPIMISPVTAILARGQFFTYTLTADAIGTYGYIGNDGIVHQAPSCAGLPAGLCFDGVRTISGTFNPPLGSDRKSPTRPNQTGGVITNLDVFRTGSGGTGILSVDFSLEPSGAGNISTRVAVGTGENVLIGGFIIEGNAPKKVVIRARGPSLTQFGVPNALADPVLDLNEQAGPLFSIDNWRDIPGQATQIIATGLQPSDDREAAMLAYLNPGPYTAVVRGKNNSTGNALVEVFDGGTALRADTNDSRLANIATRGTVLGGDSVMIGGFIIRRVATRMIIRAIGPSLTAFGISGALQDPTLELKNANGVTLMGNDDWESDPMQASEIQQRLLAPTHPRESALVTTLQPGDYTAIVSGKGGTTGVALVEGYALSNP